MILTHTQSFFNFHFCISFITQIDDFPKTQENAVLEYAAKHHNELFAPLVDSVEILDFPKMTLQSWKIESGLITLTGWFLAKLKLQLGSAEAIAAGNGTIEEHDKSFDYTVT